MKISENGGSSRKSPPRPKVQEDVDWGEVADELSSDQKYEEAIAAYEKAQAADPERTQYLYWSNVGFCLNMLTRHREALPVFDEALVVAKSGGESEDIAFVLYNIACTWCHLRDKEKALDFLAQAIALNSGLKSDAPHEPELEWLHEDPAFKALCVKTKKVAKKVKKTARKKS